MKSESTGKPLQATIIAASTMDGALEYAEKLAEAALCKNNNGLACGVCSGCRKVLSHCHPDLSYLRREKDTKGGLKKELAVRQIRDLTADAYILPNEAERKVFIIVEADLMNINAQNAILKLLEEPPNGSVFLLCVNSPGRLLPTVRSRCGLITLPSPERDGAPTGSGGSFSGSGSDGSFSGSGSASSPGDSAASALALEYLRLVSGGIRLKLMEFCVKNEGLEGEAMVEFLLAIKQSIVACFSGELKGIGLPPQRLLELAKLADRCLLYKNFNVAPKQLMGLLMVDSIKK